MNNYSNKNSINKNNMYIKLKEVAVKKEELNHSRILKKLRYFQKYNKY